MPRIAWIHNDLDPLASGELRRLGLPALAVEGADWRCDFLHADRAGEASGADLVIAPPGALRALSWLAAGRPTPLVIEIDDTTAAEQAECLAAVDGLEGRIAAVAARGRTAAARARGSFGGQVPVWLIPDAAERRTELKAAAIRFGCAWASEVDVDIPAGAELWFAEAGDRIEDAEIERLAALWRAPGEAARVAIAPAFILEWLAQSGVETEISIAAQLAPLDRLDGVSCVVPQGVPGSAARRRRKAARYGLTLRPPSDDEGGDAHDPRSVAGAWRAHLSPLLARRPAGGPASVVLVLLDLVQDLDLALPLIDELAAQPGVDTRIGITSWLLDGSPRVARELEGRGFAFERWSREDVVNGGAPSLAGVDAVLAVVETSGPAHARAHALFRRAKAAGIPTFSLQHGIENVGLTYFDEGEDPEIISDHLFVWFPRERTPAITPDALRPRLIHVGRPSQTTRPADIRGLFPGFTRLAAVFENLHWERYTASYKARFLEDCAEFAQAYPDTAVLIKPHHAGMWTARNRAAFPQWTTNLVMADPSDPLWEPYTAPSLIAAADLVITTPSTVALDAALARKPVAVAAYGMDLPAFEPLPLLQSADDWIRFGAEASSAAGARRRADFVDRSTMPGHAEKEAAAYIVAAAGAARGRLSA